jgi:hypothetical protein
MPRIDGRFIRRLQTECRDHSPVPEAAFYAAKGIKHSRIKTTANVFNKVKETVASAFRAPSLAAALA